MSRNEKNLIIVLSILGDPNSRSSAANQNRTPQRRFDAPYYILRCCIFFFFCIPFFIFAPQCVSKSYILRRQFEIESRKTPCTWLKRRARKKKGNREEDPMNVTERAITMANKAEQITSRG